MTRRIQDDDRDVVPDYSDMFIFGPRAVRIVSDLTTLAIGIFCFVVPIFLILLGTHPWASADALINSRCKRELHAAKAACIGFLDIFSTDVPKYIISDRNYSSAVGQLCPVSMLCVTNDAAPIFLATNYSDLLLETFPYTVSPPVKSFLERPSNESLQYEKFCATWGGNIPTPLGWLLLQAFISTIMTVVINLVTSIEAVNDLIERIGASISMGKFKLTRFLKRICCCCCGKKQENDDYNAADDQGSMISIHSKRNSEAHVAEVVETEESAGEVYRKSLTEAREKRADLIRRKNWVYRCFLVGNPLCILSFISLVSGFSASISFMLNSVPSAPEDISVWERYGWFVTNIFGGSATSAFVSFGTALFVHLNGKHWEFYDAAIYDLPCCGLFAPFKLFYATVRCGRDFVFDMIAPLWLFLSRVLRFCKFDDKDEAFLTLGAWFTTVYLFMSSGGWYTHVLVGFFFYYVPNMLVIGSGLFVLCLPVFYLTVITAWFRVLSIVTLPKTGRLAPVYKETAVNHVFQFLRLCSMQLFFSYIGFFLWSLSANMAQNYYINEDLRSGEGYWAAVFIELSRRSQSCYMMKIYTSFAHGMNAFMSFL